MISVVDHAEAWQRHVDANQAWVGGRYRAAAEAAAAVMRQRVSQAGLGSDGVAWVAAQKAGNVAAAQYERDVARPLWDGRPTELLHYIAEAEAAT